MTDDDLRWEFQKLADRLDEIERRQMLANSRIRQDTTSASLLIGTIMIASLLAWGGVEWRWWFALIAMPLLIFELGRAATKVQDREEPR